MKNFNQALSGFETNNSTERQGWSFKQLRKFLFQSKNQVSFYTFVIILLFSKNLSAAAPFCLSLYYNSTEADAGNDLSSSNTGSCLLGGEKVDIVCADTLLVKTIIPESALYPDFIGFRYKIENLTTSTFTYSSFSYQYVRTLEGDILTRLQFTACGRYRITNEVATDVDHDGIADHYAAESYDAYINIFKPINPTTIHVTAIPNPVCTGKTVTFTTDYIPCIYQTPIEATTTWIDDYLNKFITIDFGDGSPIYTWCQISKSGSRDVNIPFTLPALTHTYATSGVKHVIVHFSSGDTYSHATPGGGGGESLLTDGAGCWATDKDLYITVNPTPVVTITNTSNSLCTGEIQTLTASSSILGSTYQWGPPTFATTPIITTTVGGIYNVTVTSPAGCTATSSYNLELRTDCCLGNTTYSGTASSPYNITTNPTLVYLLSVGTSLPIGFNGTITITSSLTINNCSNLKWGPDAQFIIPAGKTLTINNSHLYACDVMWRGIIVNNGNCNTNNNTIIEDAKCAIDKNGCGVLNATATTFDHDLVGIHILGCGTGNLDLIENNVFKCTGGNTLKSPNLGSRTSAGIIAENTIALNLGNYLSNPLTANRFEAINSGINCWYSQVNVRNNKFTDIRVYQSSLPLATHGSAIYALGNSLDDNSSDKLYVRTNASGRSIDLMQKFINCDYAINVYGTELEVEKNVFFDCYAGITFTNCFSNAIKIYDNKIDNPAIGISGYNNIASTTQITDNEINPVVPYASIAPYGAYTNSYGIKLVEGLSPSASVSIQTNVIKNGRFGIFVQGINSNADVSENTIDFTSTASLEGKQYGIWAINCNGSLIMHNTVNGNGTMYINTTTPITSPYRKAGIGFNNSINMIITCNNTYNIGYGMYFQSDCHTAATNIRENIFTDSKYHIFMQKLGTYPIIGGFIGSYWAVNANQFTGIASSGQKSWREVDAAEPVANIPNFYYKTSLSNISPSGSNVSGKQAQQLSASTTATVSEECYVSAGIVAPGSDQILDEMIAADLLYTDDEGVQWFAKKELYDKINTDTGFISGNSILTEFYNDNLTQPLGKIKETENILTSMADSSLWMDTTLFKEKIEESKAGNDDIDAIEVQEINAKFIYGMYIRQLEEGTVIYSDEEWDEIIRLAYSCPYIEGPAVYTARAIAAIYGADDLIDDLELCNHDGYYKMQQNTTIRKAIETENNMDIILAGNPVKNQLKLLYHLPDYITTALIYDINGKKLMEANIDADLNQVMINIGMVSNGVYLLKINNTNGFTKDIKFVVAR